MKVRRNVSIDSHISEEINKRKNTYGFNFSDWIESTYKQEFLDTDRLKIKKQELLEQINKIDSKIIEIEEREKAYNSNLSRQETRFLCDTPRLLAEGKNKEALCNRFNKSFNRDWTIEKFVKTYTILVRKNGRRT